MPSRVARPWLALAGALLVLLAVLMAVLWIGEEGQQGRPAALPTASGGPAATDLPVPPRDGPEPERAPPVPIPPMGEEAAAARDAAQEEFEDPLTVYGWVVDAEGHGVPDVDVNLWDDLGDFLDSTLTDDTGAFAFAWGEPLAPEWSVGVEPDPFVDSEDPLAPVPDFYVHPAAHVPGDEPVECRLVLATAPRIEGYVFDANTRQPVSDADVEAVCLNSAWVDEYQDTFTEEDGTFVLAFTEIPARDVLLRVLGDEDQVAILGPLELAPGEVRYVEVPLQPPMTLSGTVRSAAEGTVIEGVEVALLPTHLSFENSEAWDLTWDDGSWELHEVDTPADRIWIYVEGNDGHGPTVVRPEDPTRSIEILLGAPASVSGRIVEEGSDRPVEDAVVRFVLQGPYGVVEDYEDVAYSREDGTFDMDFEIVPPTHAVVVVESDHHVRFRQPLAELVPNQVGWRHIELQIEVAPASEL